MIYQCFSLDFYKPQNIVPQADMLDYVIELYIFSIWFCSGCFTWFSLLILIVFSVLSWKIYIFLKPYFSSFWIEFDTKTELPVNKVLSLYEGLATMKVLEIAKERDMEEVKNLTVDRFNLLVKEGF